MIEAPVSLDAPGPWRWLVTWGAISQSGLRVVEVEAWEAEEAMVRAQELQPELGRPRVAFLAHEPSGRDIAPWKPHGN
ncbi:MAG: hypothetical protein NT160_05330 [Actinobacteria bacterium]|nr:hypothetical protein [Actinomycetota bacterium]